MAWNRASGSIGHRTRTYLTPRRARRVFLGSNSCGEPRCWEVLRTCPLAPPRAAQDLCCLSLHPSVASCPGFTCVVTLIATRGATPTCHEEDRGGEEGRRSPTYSQYATCTASFCPRSFQPAILGILVDPGAHQNSIPSSTD